MSKTKQVFDFFGDRKNYERVLEFCCHLFSDQDAAEDATQEIFLKLVDSSINIDFPIDRNDALKYVWRVARNYQFELFRKNKYRGMNLDKTKPETMTEVEIKRKISSAQKLDTLNDLIKKKSHLFTEDQLVLWHCMYECLSIKEIEKKLGKGKQTIYSLRNKLRDKIRGHIKLEELSD